MAAGEKRGSCYKGGDCGSPGGEGRESGGGRGGAYTVSSGPFGDLGQDVFDHRASGDFRVLLPAYEAGISDEVPF